MVKAYLHLIEAGFDASGNVDSLMFRGQSITGVPSYTWAQFIDAGFDLTLARYVHVTDRHSTRDSSATPGSVWRIDPTASTASRKRQLVSDPVYFATAAAAPDPASYPGLKIYVAGFGVGGSDWVSNGTIWRPIDHITIIYMNTTGHTHGATFTTEEIAYQVVIPLDVNNASMWQPGDVLSINNCIFYKTGNADTFNVGVRIGSAGTTADTLVYNGTNIGPSIGFTGQKWIRLSDSGGNSIVERIDVDALTVLSGPSTNSKSASDTLTGYDIDSAATYINLTYKVNASTTDTALKSGYCEIALIKGA
jgi:hypothetical protein